MLSAFLNANDAKRASDVVEKLLANDFRGCALTGDERRRAVRIATETAGVSKVVNHLNVP